MVNVAKVKLYDYDLGIVQWNDSQGLARFEYIPAFISTGIQPSPITMPVKEGRVYTFAEIGRETFKGLPGLLADSLPDTYGRALFDRWLALTGRTIANPIETLCYLGKRSMGALEFEPAMDKGHNPTEKIEVELLVDVANEVLRDKTDFITNLSDDKKKGIADIVRLGTSAGGQRAKAIIAFNKNTGEVRSGQIDVPEGFEHYIIKLDGVSAEAGYRETQNFGRLEYSFYLLAKESGILMSDSFLLEENGRAHFMTKRFDREGSKKIHMQTLCGIAHYDYRMPRVYSYEQAFNVMRTLHLPYSEAQEMFRRMVFNVVIRNQDDHTKNISFLMDRLGKWKLSPAYDIGFAYNPKGHWTASHQMSINGKFDNLTRQDLLRFAEKNNIKEAKEIIDNVNQTVMSWSKIAYDVGVPSQMIDAVKQHFNIL